MDDRLLHLQRLVILAWLTSPIQSSKFQSEAPKVAKVPGELTTITSNARNESKQSSPKPKTTRYKWFSLLF